MIQWDSKELLDNVRHKLFEDRNRIVTDTEIANTIRMFFSVVRKITSVPNKYDTLYQIGSINIPKLGKINFNSELKRKLLIGNTRKIVYERPSSEDILRTSENLYSYGWKFFKWNPINGFIFVHEESGSVHCLDTKRAVTRHQARKQFLEQLETDLTIKGILPVKKLKLVPFEWKPIKSIYKYNLNGEYLGKYSNIHEVSLEFKILGMDVYNKLRANEKEGFTSLINGFVLLIADGYVGPRVFTNPIRHQKYNDLVSILDKNTNEVLFYRIGTILEASKFLRYLGNKNRIEPYYINKKGLIENKVVYGYRWRREVPCQNDKP